MIHGSHTLHRADARLPWRPLVQQWPKPDKQWRNWLLDPGSLTHRLQALSDGAFRVQLVEEGWCYSGAGDRSLFTGDIARGLMWSRRVLLLGEGEPWVAAHSLIPVSSLRGSLRQLVKLRERPLGGFLFKHPNLRRQEPQVARLADHWGRRSLFFLDSRPLLVAEFFLPALISRQNLLKI